MTSLATQTPNGHGDSEQNKQHDNVNVNQTPPSLANKHGPGMMTSPVYTTSAPTTPIPQQSTHIPQGSDHNTPPRTVPHTGAGNNCLQRPMSAQPRYTTAQNSRANLQVPHSAKHRKNDSLVEFDPLSPQAGQVPSSNQQAGNILAKIKLPLTDAMSAQAGKRNGRLKKHRRDIQSFCTADLRTISHQASEEEGSSPKPPLSIYRPLDEATLNAWQPPTTPTSPVSPTRKASISPKGGGTGKATSKSPIRGFLASPLRSKGSTDSHTDPAKKSVEGKPKKSLTHKILSKVTKGHRRTKSMETSESTLKDLSISPLPNELTSKEFKEQVTPSMYDSVVTDLMQLKVDDIQLPTLAKPAPTSFLTGREGEVMRTCENEAAPFQMEIPTLQELLIAARLNEFVDTYRDMDQNLDLQEWKGLSTMALKQINVEEHIPIAQLLLDCGEGVTVQGFASSGDEPDKRVEAVIFEGQSNFFVVIRGTTEQQLRPCPKMTFNRKTVPIDGERKNVEVYDCFMSEYQKIERKCFEMLDSIMDENPFCDVVFTGHSFGAVLSTLAAVRYANARPMMRAKCYPMGSPKVGFAEFRQMVNSSPNLRVVRVEYGQDAKCQLPSQGGVPVGHTLVLSCALGHKATKIKDPILAYKFDAPKQVMFKTITPDLRSYVMALEEIASLKIPWVSDYVGAAGQGVVVNEEARQMV